MTNKFNFKGFWDASFERHKAIREQIDKQVEAMGDIVHHSSYMDRIDKRWFREVETKLIVETKVRVGIWYFYRTWGNKDDTRYSDGQQAFDLAGNLIFNESDDRGNCHVSIDLETWHGPCFVQECHGFYAWNKREGWWGDKHFYDQGTNVESIVANGPRYIDEVETELKRSKNGHSNDCVQLIMQFTFAMLTL